MRKLKSYIKIVVPSVLLVLTTWIAWNYYDVYHFIQWVRVAEREGILRLYSEAPKCGYMPLAPLLFIISYLIAKNIITLAPLVIKSILSFDYLIFIVKIPLLVATVATGYLLYKREGWEIAKWWFYGIPVWLVAFTYQFDPIMVFFMLLGIYCLIDGRYRLSGIFMGIGAAFKFIPLLVMPLGYRIIKNNRERIEYTMYTLLPIAIVSLPFVLFDMRSFVNKVFGFHINRYPQMLSIFNIPQLLTHYNISLTGMEWLNTLWFPLFITLYFIVYLGFNVKPGDKDSFFLFVSSVILLFLLFNKVQNPNYILWVYPFLIYWMTLKKKRLFKILLLIAIVLGTLGYPTLLYFPAAVLNKPIFIEEDAAWYNARELLLNSFTSSLRVFVTKTIEWFDVNAHKQMVWLYTNFNIIGALTIALYNGLLCTILYLILKENNFWKRIGHYIRFLRFIGKR